MEIGVTNETIEKINYVFNKHKSIEEVILYGSRALGRHTNGSDIDISLKGENIDIGELLIIMNELDDLLLPYKFDISIFNSLKNEDLIEHINVYGKKIYTREKL